MSGVGKTTAARALARRHDLHVYSLDSRTYAHAERLASSVLAHTADELWLDRAPEQMADDFEAEARLRFPLVLQELAALPDDGAPIVVEGPQLLPELVDGAAVFVVAAPALQRRLVQARGSFTYARTSDPDRALANRLRRDEHLADRLRARADVLEVSDVKETEPVVAAAFAPALAAWVARSDHGDVASRRRGDNDRRFEQWRRYAAHELRALEGELEFSCECARPGCEQTVTVRLADAQRRPLLAHA